MSDKKIQKKNLKRLLGEFSIEIPALQRDYAQGRWAQKEIGKGFVNALIEALDDEKSKGLHLDFIYGYVEGQVSVEGGNAAGDSLKKLILIDGQQRLTTLWLLHLYLYKRAGKIDGEKDWLGRFFYAARSGAKEFCQALLEQDFLDSGAKKPSDLIYDKSPLFGGMRLLRHDPTVAAMLNMLDWIHEGAKNKNPDELVNKLEGITFDFFDMKQFELGQEIYIKMNARGKALSEYENIKALMEKGVKDKELLRRIDAEWSDYFYSDNDDSNFKERARLFDVRGKNFLHYGAWFFNLDRVFGTNGVQGKMVKDIQELLDGIKRKQLSMEFYEVLQEKNLKQLDRVMRLLKSLQKMSLLGDLLEHERLGFLSQPSFFDGLTYKGQCYFFGLIAYCKKEDSLVQIREESKIEDLNVLLGYLRILRNLVENHPESFDDYMPKFFYLIQEVSGRAHDISGLEDRIEELELYDNIFALEVRKAKLIKSDDGQQWEEIFNKLGRHPLLRGRVDFLLDFSDVNYEKSKGEQGVQKLPCIPNLQGFKKYADVMLEILKHIPSNEDKSSYSSERLAHLQRLWFMQGGDYGPKGWYRIYYGSAFGESFSTRNLWHGRFVAEGETPHFYKFLKWLCGNCGMKQLRSEKWDAESKDYASRFWWEQLLIRQGEHFAFINQGEGRIMRFDNEGRVRLSRGKRDSKNAANSRDLLCHGFYHYCRSEYELDVGDYKNEDKFEVKQGGKSYLLGVQYIGDKHRANIMIDNKPYLIDFKSEKGIFTEFKKVLKEAGVVAK